MFLDFLDLLKSIINFKNKNILLQYITNEKYCESQSQFYSRNALISHYIKIIYEQPTRAK
jgi:hypothetical protein